MTYHTSVLYPLGSRNPQQPQSTDKGNVTIGQLLAFAGGYYPRSALRLGLVEGLPVFITYKYHSLRLS